MKKTNQKKQSVVKMPLVHPDAAGIDVGDTIHAVAVPEDRDEERVRSFGTMTCDLEEIIEWLRQCRIDTGAMESTGVYWKPLFNMLCKEGFEVYQVNSKHAKNVSGRKNDEDDACWIQKLHSCGLLKSSYLPESEQESLRTLVRHRKTLISDRNRFILRMQKAMEMMNTNCIQSYGISRERQVQPLWKRLSEASETHMHFYSTLTRTLKLIMKQLPSL